MRILNSKSRTSLQKHGLTFGMVGTYKSYLGNVKRKGKVIFDHSTTLMFITFKILQENFRCPSQILINGNEAFVTTGLVCGF